MWETALLGDIATVIAGQSPQSRHYNKDGNGMPFYQGKKDYGKKYLNPPTVWTTKVTKQAIKGDLLMSVRAPVGALNIATQEICVGRGLAAIRVNEKVTLNYLYFALLSVSNELVGSPGAVFNSINKEQVENIPLPLPPLVEQKRIVTKLDSAFAEIDKAIAATERKKAEVVNLKRAVLADKLSASDDTAVIKIDDACKFIRGLTYSKKDETDRSQTAVLRATNINLNTYRLTFDKIRYINDSVQISDEKYAKAGDIIMCTASGSKSHLGKVALVTKDTGMAFGGFMAALRTTDKCLSAYFYLILMSPPFVSHVANLSEGTNIHNLKFSQIANFEFPLPPLAEQNRIVEKLDAIFTNADKVADIATKQLANYQALKSAILKQELQGETK